MNQLWTYYKCIIKSSFVVSHFSLHQTISTLFSLTAKVFCSSYNSWVYYLDTVKVCWILHRQHYLQSLVFCSNLSTNSKCRLKDVFCRMEWHNVCVVQRKQVVGVLQLFFVMIRIYQLGIFLILVGIDFTSRFDRMPSLLFQQCQHQGIRVDTNVIWVDIFNPIDQKYIFN